MINLGSFNPQAGGFPAMGTDRTPQNAMPAWAQTPPQDLQNAAQAVQDLRAQLGGQNYQTNFLVQTLQDSFQKTANVVTEIDSNGFPTSTFFTVNAFRDDAGAWRKADVSAVSWALQFDSSGIHFYVLHSPAAEDPIVWQTRLNMVGSGGTTILPNTEGGLTVAPWGTAAGDTGEILSRELAANGTNVAGFKAPDNLAANLILTLPEVDGVAGAPLITDGNKKLSFGSIAVDRVRGFAEAVYGYASQWFTKLISTRPGTFTKVTVNEFGQVTSGTKVTANDLSSSGTTDGQVLTRDSTNAQGESWQTNPGSWAPNSATYVTMSTDATLTSERVLTAGTNITITDGGPGGAVTVSTSGSPSPSWAVPNRYIAAARYQDSNERQTYAGLDPMSSYATMRRFQ